MRTAFSDALVAAALADPKVLLLTGDHGYALFDAFRKARPAQYINCGIAEQNMVGVAAGLAKAGFKPIVYGLAAFVPMRVLEQIKIDVCYENLPVILIGDGAGLVYSHLGTSHQCTEDIACTRAVPALTVLSPADRFEMTATMQLALRLASPVYLRVGKSDRGDVHAGPVPLQAGDMLRVGTGSGRIALLATGSMVRTAMELVGQGIDAEVWSVPSIKPLNHDQLHAIASRVSAVVTLEEHSIMGGLGACVAEELAAFHPLPVCRIGVQDRFSALCGTWDYLLHEHQLDLLAVRQRIDSFLAKLPAGHAETSGTHQPS
jgi:transketolase